MLSSFITFRKRILNSKLLHTKYNNCKSEKRTPQKRLEPLRALKDCTINDIGSAVAKSVLFLAGYKNYAHFSITLDYIRVMLTISGPWKNLFLEFNIKDGDLDGDNRNVMPHHKE